MHLLIGTILTFVGIYCINSYQSRMAQIERRLTILEKGEVSPTA